MTDFFGSVRNIELLNMTNISVTRVPSYEGQSDAPGVTNRENLPSGHLLVPQDSLVRNVSYYMDV